MIRKKHSTLCQACSNLSCKIKLFSLASIIYGIRLICSFISCCYKCLFHTSLSLIYSKVHALVLMLLRKYLISIHISVVWHFRNLHSIIKVCIISGFVRNCILYSCGIIEKIYWFIYEHLIIYDVGTLYDLMFNNCRWNELDVHTF